MTVDRSMGILCGVATLILIGPIVLAVQRDRHGRGERVPRRVGTIISWMLGLSVVAVGACAWWWASEDTYVGSQWSWTMVTSLAAMGALGVVRPRWASWELAITALAFPIVVVLVVSAMGQDAGGAYTGVVLMYVMPALVASGYFRASVPGGRSTAGSPAIATEQSDLGPTSATVTLPSAPPVLR